MSGNLKEILNNLKSENTVYDNFEAVDIHAMSTSFAFYLSKTKIDNFAIYACVNLIRYTEKFRYRKFRYIDSV
jgi:hypothetical protein